jgi:tetratricopeptide (TPR) repeat protein
LLAAAEEFPADLEPQRRESILTELSELADHEDLPVYRVAALILTVNRAAYDLDLDEARRLNREVHELAHAYQLRQATFLADALEAMLTLMSGDVERAEALYLQAYDSQLTRGTVDAGPAMLLVRTILLYARGRLGEMVDELAWAYENVLPAVAHLLGLALAERGELRRAREILDEAPALLHDYMWLIFATMRAHTVAAVRASDLAPALYESLLPYADRVAGAATNAFVIGPVGLALGRLALLLDPPDDALRHFEQARAVAERCGSRIWLDQVAADLAALARR